MHNLSHQINIFFLDYLSDNIILLDNIKLPGYVKRDSANKAATKTELKKDHENVLESCDTLAKKVVKHNKDAENVLSKISSEFSASVDLMMSTEMSSYLRKMCEEDYPVSLRCLTSLALKGPTMCRLLVRGGVITTLLRVMRGGDGECRVLALRALGCVSCVVEGIRELVVLGGLDMVVHHLENLKNSEDERREAVGVLAQVTSPWIEGNVCVEGIKQHTASILHSIKGSYR